MLLLTLKRLRVLVLVVEAGRRAHHCRSLVPASHATVDVDIHPLAQLLQEEGTLEAHLHDSSVKSDALDLRFIIGGLHLVETALELDAFAVIGLLDARGQGRALCLGVCEVRTVCQPTLCHFNHGQWTADEG